MYPQSMFLAKNKKNINFLFIEKSFLQPLKIAVYYIGMFA